MARKESQFSAQIRSDLEEVYGENIFVYLIRDMRGTGKKPYDFHFMYRSITTCVECKRVDGHTFNFRNEVKPHQPVFLRKIIKTQNVGLFLICFHRYKAAFALSPNMMDTLVQENGEAITYDNFEAHVLTNQIFKIVRQKIGDQTRWHVERLIDAAFQL